jgi:hypothetical protein
VLAHLSGLAYVRAERETDLDALRAARLAGLPAGEVLMDEVLSALREEGIEVEEHHPVLLVRSID